MMKNLQSTKVWFCSNFSHFQHGNNGLVELTNLMKAMIIMVYILVSQLTIQVS